MIKIQSGDFGKHLSVGFVWILLDPFRLSVSSGSSPGEMDGSRGAIRPGVHTPE